MSDRTTKCAWFAVVIQLLLFSFLCAKWIFNKNTIALSENKASVAVTIKPCVCSHNWTYFEASESCYKVGHFQNFGDAFDACRIENSSLTSIHSDEENEFVNKLASIGFQVISEANLTLIGVHRVDVHGDFMNVDNSIFNYQNWASDGLMNQQKCVVTYSEVEDNKAENLTHKWFDIDCNYVFRSFVCKNKAIC